MELYQLKTFVTVADEGHLTRASERLHASQPAVSAHIKSLEEEKVWAPGVLEASRKKRLMFPTSGIMDWFESHLRCLY